MTTLVDKILRRVAAVVAPKISLAAYPALIRREVVGFTYHMVSNESLPHVSHLYPYKKAAEFEQDLLYFKRHFTPVSYQQLVDYVALGPRRAPLPPKAAFISFDDGFQECYTVVRPLLLKHKLTAIFFLTTEAVDNRRLVYNNKVSLCIEVLLALPLASRGSYLEKLGALAGKSAAVQGLAPSSAAYQQAIITWLRGLTHEHEDKIDAAGVILGIDYAEYLKIRQPYLTVSQIQEMHREGFTFGGHTRSHTKLMHLSQAEQAQEIVSSCQVVAKWVGESSAPFAFPFSGAYVNRPFLRELRQSQAVVGLYFDINQLRRDRLESIFNRIWVDKPVKGILPEQNLEYALHQAYQWTLVDRFSSRDF